MAAAGRDGADMPGGACQIYGAFRAFRDVSAADGPGGERAVDIEEEVARAHAVRLSDITQKQVRSNLLTCVHTWSQ